MHFEVQFYGCKKVLSRSHPAAGCAPLLPTKVRWTLQFMEKNTLGSDGYKTLQQIETTAYERYSSKTPQHMDAIANGRYRYRTRQHMDNIADRPYRFST